MIKNKLLELCFGIVVGVVVHISPGAKVIILSRIWTEILKIVIIVIVIIIDHSVSFFKINLCPKYELIISLTPGPIHNMR